MISGYQEKKAPMTTDLHVLFHRPLAIGKATMKVSLIKLGARSATSEGRIFNPEGKLVATLMHTAQPVDVA
jgi:acyl-coenzyme A thioesterase PaaI-like protein